MNTGQCACDQAIRISATPSGAAGRMVNSVISINDRGQGRMGRR